MKTYGLVIDVAVPTKANRFGAFCLFQTTKVELQVFVIEIDRGDR